MSENGWSGRAPALPASQTGNGAPKTKEHAMSQKHNSKIAVIGIDIGKNSFHIVGQDRRGALVRIIGLLGTVCGRGRRCCAVGNRCGAVTSALGQ